ncbi:hypothetical protein THSYN_12025 [Candidatus Thiodictyon syntrophicum]|uniref:Sulfatase-modifying factor enzyme-like domain-containing protein n=2 Tax=Candidatus Thiodictyon syntrophicum TaxID=1166950 RepID=A0A2K8UGR3_9GAMM|nr:hypothetical protein THSYN_12025 [Candidatus Thiodictyon syntrophicum]
MVRIAEGSFLMGSPWGEPERDNNEGPQHHVQVPAFELGKYEVTFDQWDACVSAGGCTHRPQDQGWGRGTRPVVNVSWDDAQGYVKWLSTQTGKQYRLPSEAEWEYAARAGTTTPFSTGNCITTAQANYNGNYDYADCGAKTGVWLQKTQPVGSYPANRWGLYDMHGNAVEWVQDSWHTNYQGAPGDGSAWEDAGGRERVLRGGGWTSDGRSCRSAIRGGDDPGRRYDFFGFRLSRGSSPPGRGQ